jgi:hypothetical protein
MKLEDKNKVVLRFVERRLQLVVVRNQRAVKFVEMELPEDLVGIEKVKDVEGLAKQIHFLLGKVGVKKTRVAVCLPEKGAYVKVIRLLKVRVAEVDSALRWHLDNYLPYNAEEVYWDWRLVKEDKEGVDILVLAVTKDWADLYLKAVELAGLEIILLESTSIGLKRMFELSEEDTAVLVEEGEERATVLICRDGFVMNSNYFSLKEGDIFSQIKKAVNYYQSKSGVEKIDRIYILGKDSGLGKRVAEEMGIEEGQVKEKWGLSKEFFNKYGVVVSTGVAEALSPESEKTINLLPRKMVLKMKEKKEKESMKKSWNLIYICLLILGGVIWVANFYLYLKLGGVERAKDQFLVQIKQVDKRVLEEVNVLPGLIDSMNSLVENRDKYFWTVKKVLDKTPLSLSLSRVSVDYVKKEGKLSGFADRRESLLEYKKSLEEQGFLNIEVPLSSLEKSRNFDFVINFSF